MNVKIIETKEVLGKELSIYGTIENPLFKAKDVADWIGNKNVTEMVSKIDKCEVTRLNLGGLQGVCNFLTEDGLYEVLMLSKKPIAKAYKRQVKKILKTLRVTGGYVLSADKMVDTYFGNLDENHKGIVKSLFANIESQQKLICEQMQTIELQEPKVDYYDNLIDVSHLTNFRDTAKELKVSQKALIEALLDMNILFREVKYGHLRPYMIHISKGHFELKDYARNGSAGTQTLVTVKGKEYIKNLLGVA